MSRDDDGFPREVRDRQRDGDAGRGRPDRGEQRREADAGHGQRVEVVDGPFAPLGAGARFEGGAVEDDERVAFALGVLRRLHERPGVGDGARRCGALDGVATRRVRPAVVAQRAAGDVDAVDLLQAHEGEMDLAHARRDHGVVGARTAHLRDMGGEFVGLDTQRDAETRRTVEGRGVQVEALDEALPFDLGQLVQPRGGHACGSPGRDLGRDEPLLQLVGDLAGRSSEARALGTVDFAALEEPEPCRERQRQQEHDPRAEPEAGRSGGTRCGATAGDGVRGEHARAGVRFRVGRSGLIGAGGGGLSVVHDPDGSRESR